VSLCSTVIIVMLREMEFEERISGGQGLGGGSTSTCPVHSHGTMSSERTNLWNDEMSWLGTQSSGVHRIFDDLRSRTFRPDSYTHN